MSAWADLPAGAREAVLDVLRDHAKSERVMAQGRRLLSERDDKKARKIRGAFDRGELLALAGWHEISATACEAAIDQLGGAP